jgi:hypothetical protein
MLARFRNLNEMYLDNTPIHGHSLDALTNLHLTFLGLTSTKLDQLGFEKLGSLSSVDDVGLKDTAL